MSRTHLEHCMPHSMPGGRAQNAHCCPKAKEDGGGHSSSSSLLPLTLPAVAASVVQAQTFFVLFFSELTNFPTLLWGQFSPPMPEFYVSKWGWVGWE